MNKGIYCKRKTNIRLYNSILIDEYNKFTSEKPDFEVEVPSTMSKYEPASTSVKTHLKDEIWKENMHVRAQFSEDGNFYEAVITKILDNKCVEVQFVGYNNFEVVKIENLKRSKGLKFIKEQEKLAELDEDEENENGFEDSNCSDEEEPPEIEWSVGMPCRALYQDNNVIYEGVVRKVNKSNRTALIHMIGYDVEYEANFSDMYESILELRIKQENMANMTKNLKKTSNLPATSTIVPDSAKLPNIEPGPGVTIPIPPLPDTLRTNIPSQVDQNFANSLGNGSCSYNQHHGIMQPQTENDALACLISSNYLSGYYAGFYDCLRKLQEQKNNS